MTDPLTGREPALPAADSMTGREPFIGGEASIAQALLQLDDADIASIGVLVARLAGALPQLAILLHDEDEHKRSQAARLIGMVAAGHPRSRGQSVPLLAGILDDALAHNDREIAGIAIDRLGETSDPLAADALIRIMSSGGIFGYVSRIFASFGKLGIVATPSLLTAAGQEMEVDWACFALAEVCRVTPEAIPTVVAQVTPLLLNGQLLSYPARDSIKCLLHQLHSTSLVYQMIGFISSQSRDKTLRRRMLLMLANIPDSQASASMFDWITDTTFELRGYAARALCRLRLRQDIPRIIETIRLPDLRTRSYAITIAGMRKIKSAVPAIVEALSDNHAGVRRRAVIALRRLRVESTIPTLIRMANDHSKAVRLEMVTTLSSIHHYFPAYRTECGIAFQKLLTDPDVKVRQEAEQVSPYYHY